MSQLSIPLSTPLFNSSVHSSFARDIYRRSTDHYPFFIRQPRISSDPYFVRHLRLETNLNAHSGCVNSIAWSEDGNLLLSGSDDCHLNIWSAFNPPADSLLHSIRSGHNANIFSARFMPCTSSHQIVSCSADGVVRHTDVEAFIHAGSNYSASNRVFSCHMDLVYEVLPEPHNPYIFYDASDDGTVNRYDLRIRSFCSCSTNAEDECRLHTLINLNPGAAGITAARTAGRMGRANRMRHLGRTEDHSITSISIDPLKPTHLATGCADECVRIWDQRYIQKPCYIFRPMRPSKNPEGVESGGNGRNRNIFSGSMRGNARWIPSRITSVEFDPKGTGEFLVSYSSGEIKLVRPGGGGETPDSCINGGRAKFKRKNVNPREDEKKNLAPSPEYSSKKGEEENARDRKDSAIEMDSGKYTTPVTSLTSQMTNCHHEVAHKNVQAENDAVVESSREFGQEGEHEKHLRMFIDELKRASGMITEEEHGRQEDCDISSEEEAMNQESDDDDSDEDYPDDDCKEDYQNELVFTEQDVVMTYTGHRNKRTMIKEANFFGSKSEYVLSGSDDGRIFIWDKKTGHIINILKGDNSVVNCVQPHPFDEPIIASSGIDNDIKLWYPNSETEPDNGDMESIIRENHRRKDEDDDGPRIMLSGNIIMQLLALIEGDDS